MGTFRARFTLTGTSGTAFNTGGAGDNAWHAYENKSGVGQINFDILGSNFFLDGSGTGIPFTSLPTGMLLTGNQSLTSPIVIVSPAFSGKVGFEEFTGGANNHITYNISYGTYSKNLVDQHIGAIPVTDIAFTSIVDLINILNFSINQVKNPGVVQSYVADIIDITGTYSIAAFSFTYSIPDTSVNTIGPDNKVKITSTYPATGALDLSKIVQNGIDPDTGDYNSVKNTGITGIGLLWFNLSGAAQKYFLPLRYIDDIVPDLLEFEIPPELAYLIWKDPTLPGYPNIPVTPIIYGDGTQFSGWVQITPLTVTIVDASGVYRLVGNKTSDTLYNNLNPPATYNIAIPEPFGRTGFIE